MLLFGHAGITFGVATVLANLPPVRIRTAEHARLYSAAASSQESSQSPFDSLASVVDIRILLIGSLLPDIIDKPLMFILPQALGGRDFAHSLLFLVLISLGGAYLYRRSRRKWLLTLSFGAVTHLLLDQTWQCLHALFWPFYSLHKADVGDWMPDMINGLFSNPAVYVPEVAGFAVLAWFAYLVFRRRRVGALIRYAAIR